MSEVQDMAQILMVSGKGIYMMGEISVKALQFLMQLEHSSRMKKLSRSVGEMSYNDLLEAKGGELQIMEVNTQDEKEILKVKQELTERKIAFSQLPDFDSTDGFTQFMVHVSDASKVNAYYRSHPGFARQTTADAYMGTASEKDLKEVHGEAAFSFGGKKEKKQGEKINFNQAEELKNDSAYKQMSLNPNVHKITVNRELFVSETEHEMLTRIPGTKKQQYLITPKEHAFTIDGGKTYLIFLDKERKYDICDKLGNKMGVSKGEDLVGFYDRVNRKIVNAKTRTTAKKVGEKTVEKAIKGNAPTL